MEKEKKSLKERFMSLSVEGKILSVMLIVLVVMFIIGLMVDSSTSSKSVVQSAEKDSTSYQKGASNKTIIDCARTEVDKLLRSSSTAVWSEKAKILDKDEYGRYLVYVPLEAQNGFGGYKKLEYLVIVSNVTSDGHYSSYTYSSTYEITGFFSDNYQKNDYQSFKERNHWGESQDEIKKQS